MNTRNHHKIVEIQSGRENDPQARNHAMTVYTVVAVLASMANSVANSPLF